MPATWEKDMAWGFRRPSIRGRIATRISVKRYVRQSLGLKVPRGWGWLTNPRKAAYNRIYNRTTFGLGKGCLVMVLLMVAPLVAIVVMVVREWLS
jgi:hypothetical protein